MCKPTRIIHFILFSIFLLVSINVKSIEPLDNLYEVESPSTRINYNNEGIKTTSIPKKVSADEFDLAMIKVLEVGQDANVSTGDIVTYEIFIINQGDIAADNIEITDYIPSCFTLVDNSWANNGNGTASKTISTSNGLLMTPLQPGAYISVTLALEVGACNGVTEATNGAEISNATDQNGSPVVDVDSNSDNNSANDTFLENDDTTGDGKNGGDEDDHDTEVVTISDIQTDIFDLALNKTLPAGQGNHVPENSIVIYNINIFNQGNVAADNIEIIDYMPSCATLVDGNWTDNGNGTVSQLLSVANGKLTTALLAGQNMTVQISLSLDDCNFGTVSNGAEIVSSTDGNGNAVTDVDSTPDNNPNNDPNNEDDHDTVDITIDPLVDAAFDLALNKILAPGQSDQVVDGSVVVFNINIYNQGNVAADNIRIVDYLPACFDLVPGGGWIYDAATHQAIRILSVLNNDMAAPLAPGQNMTIPITIVLNSCNNGPKLNYAEIENATDGDDNDATDIDSEMDDDQYNDVYTSNNYTGGNGNAGEDEDDHDLERIDVIVGPAPVYDIALIKIIAAGQQTSVLEGDILTFQIQVTNQGTAPLDNIQIIDYLASCTTLQDNDWIDNGNGTASYTLSTSNGTLDAPLSPGQSRLVPITILIGACESGSQTNTAEVSGLTDGQGNPVSDVDSTPDTNPNNDIFITNNDISGNGGDEDDSDIELFDIIPLFDLALSKTIITPANYTYGHVMPFNITVYNQGNVIADNIEITDYMPSGYTFSSVLNPGWIENVDGTLTYVITNNLGLNSQIVIPLNLILVRGDGSGTAWDNYVEISDATNKYGEPQEDVDSYMDDFPYNDNKVFPGDDNDDKINENSKNGGDQDDSDPAGVEVFDLALIKTTNETGPFRYGDEVTFTIRIYNQGNVPATNIEIVDYIPCGFKYLNSNNNLWNYNSGTRKAKMTFTGTLNPESSGVVSITLVAQECYNNVAEAWTNISEINNATDTDTTPREDIDGSFDEFSNNDGNIIDNEINNPTDEDNHDVEKITVIDLALTKDIAFKGPYAENDIANYNITVYNQGNVNLYNIDLVDYLRKGYSFNTGINTGWVLSGTQLHYLYNGPLVPGASIVVPLNLTVAVPADAQLGDWYNEAEIAQVTDITGNVLVDADSDADNNPDNDNDLIDGPDDDIIFDEDDNNDNVINENIFDPFSEGDDDEDDNDAAEIIVVGGLGGYTWKDLDGDGIYEGGEPGLANVVVTLTDCDGNFIASQLSGADGFYFFNNLIPGDYQVHYNISGLGDDCAFTLLDQGNDDSIDNDANLAGNTRCYPIQGGQYDTTAYGGVLPLASIGNFVWEDLNGDGIQNANEPRIEGVTVNLLDENGNSEGTTTTNANGFYLFNKLYPGNYYLEFITPDGFSDITFPNQGFNNGLDSDVDGTNGVGTTTITNLSAGENDLTWDAGYYHCIPFGNIIWHDVIKNNVLDDIENGINGLRVNIYKKNGPSWVLYDYVYSSHKPNTPSDDGWYEFCVAPGQYYIEVVLPPQGLVTVVPHIGADEFKDSDIDDTHGVGTTDDYTVISGDTQLDIGAGYCPMAQIGGSVWYDENCDGIQTNNELPVANVIVRVFNSDNIEIGSTITDESGFYNINYLKRDDVYVKYDLPSGYHATISNFGNNSYDDIDSDIDHSFGLNTTSIYQIEPGDSIVSVDAGISSCVLPLDWNSITASNKGDYNIVEWSTLSEINTDYFILEVRHETEGNFHQIAKVDAVGFSSRLERYTGKDYDVDKEGIYYYRVTGIDKDGSKHKSDVVIIKLSSKEKGYVTLYPNPTATHVTLEYRLFEKGNVKVRIYDLAGKHIMLEVFDGNREAGEYMETINLSDITEGMYIVRIEKEGEVVNKRLFVLKN